MALIPPVDQHDRHRARREADAMPRFGARRPGQPGLQLHESPSDRELWTMLERAELDLALSMFPLEAACLAAKEVLRDPYVLVVSSESPSAGGVELAGDDPHVGLEGHDQLSGRR
jgi:DNA-binding transcriptional LysR family regulator